MTMALFFYYINLIPHISTSTNTDSLQLKRGGLNYVQVSLLSISHFDRDTIILNVSFYRVTMGCGRLNSFKSYIYVHTTFVYIRKAQLVFYVGAMKSF